MSDLSPPLTAISHSRQLLLQTNFDGTLWQMKSNQGPLFLCSQRAGIPQAHEGAMSYWRPGLPPSLLATLCGPMFPGSVGPMMLFLLTLHPVRGLSKINNIYSRVQSRWKKRGVQIPSEWVHQTMEVIRSVVIKPFFHGTPEPFFNRYEPALIKSLRRNEGHKKLTKKNRTKYSF